MNRVATFDRDASALEDRLDQFDITHPAGGVKRRAPINTPGGFVETEAEHEARRLPAAIENGLRQTRVIGRCERGQHRRIPIEARARACFVASQHRVDEAHVRRASAHEQIVDIAMPELQGHVVR